MGEVKSEIDLKTTQPKEIENIIGETKNSIYRDISKLFSEMAYFSDKVYANKANYDEEYLKWSVEMLTKNKMIHLKKATDSSNLEKVQRQRGRVFWSEFGVNVGSEFNYPHFCVVIKEFDYTAIVVPLSSVKEDDTEWKCPDNLIVEIGVIENIPNERKSSYALVNQIQTVSKKRLSNYRDNMGCYHDKLKLNNGQLDLIDNQILKLVNKSK